MRTMKLKSMMAALLITAIPAWGQDLPRAAASSQLDKAVTDYLQAVEEAGQDLHSLMIVQHGNVVAEHWMSQGKKDEPHILNSVSKTFTATAVGLAIHEGRLKLTDKLVSFFPDKLPAEVSDNLAAVSVGFLLGDEDDAVVWRGPKKNGLIKQFLRDVDWGEYGLDWLVVDTPPGTSDEHLSVVQHLKSVADGAIIVTTPQDVALADVRKEVMFCRKVGLRIIGVVENMSGFVCPCCHKASTIFPKTSGGAEAMAKEMGLRFLGRIPLDPLIARSCDEGRPYFAAHPDSDATKQFLKLFDGILEQLTAATATAATSTTTAPETK